MKDNVLSRAKQVLGKHPVKKGDVLLTAEPFAYVVKSSLQGLHCEHCFAKRQVLQRCSGCKITRYCSRDCQRASWENHKKECVHLKKIRPKVPPDTVRLIARIILKLKDGGDAIEGRVTDSKIRKFQDLMNHYKDLKEDVKRQEHFVTIVEVLKEYIGEDLLPNLADLLGIYGRVCINSFNITDTSNNTVGVGVYLAASIFDHSCQPNAFASFIGSQVIIRSLVDMPELEWSKVRICYIDVLNTTEDRRKDLHNRYYFWCDCPWCNNTNRDKLMSCIKCGNSSCDAPVIVDVSEPEDKPIGSCAKCGFKDFDERTRSKYYEVLKYSKEKLEEMGEITYLDVAKIMLDRQESLFHRINLWRVKTTDAAYEAAINAASWEAARYYGLENLTGIKFYYGPQHPYYGTILVKLAKIEMFLLHIPEALQHLLEAKSVLLVTHGADHPLLKKELEPLLVQAKQEMQLLQVTGRKKKLQYNPPLSL